MSLNHKYADISLGSNQIHGYPNTKHCSCIFHDPCFDSMINKKSYDEFKELKNSPKTKFCAFIVFLINEQKPVKFFVLN